jgi:hypothetical protein
MIKGEKKKKEGTPEKTYCWKNWKKGAFSASMERIM